MIVGDLQKAQGFIVKMADKLAEYEAVREKQQTIINDIHKSLDNYVTWLEDQIKAARNG